jgi:hypothetical protein
VKVAKLLCEKCNRERDTYLSCTPQTKGKATFGLACGECGNPIKLSRKTQALLCEAYENGWLGAVNSWKQRVRALLFEIGIR